MASESAIFSESGLEDDFQPYRALSKSAVFSLVLSLLSIVSILFPPALLFGLLGLVFGLVSLLTFRRYPAELTGLPLAILGTGLGGIMFVGGTAFQIYDYLTELPPGYERVSFHSLKAPSGKPDQPTSDALAMNDKRVFIKGYMYPDGQGARIKRFVLVPDLGTCCFGGQPKLTHMIEVTLDGPPGIDYSLRKRKLAGTLKVNDKLKRIDGLGGVFYQLTADYAK